MTNATLDKTTIGFGLSVAAVNILNMLLVVFKELAPSLKKAMAAGTGHHWTTHGVLLVGLFIVLGFVFSSAIKPESWSAGKLSRTIVWSVIIGGCLLAVFYLLH
jgi:hypothetical protein